MNKGIYYNKSGYYDPTAGAALNNVTRQRNRKQECMEGRLIMAQDYAKGFYNSPAWRRCRDGFMQSKHYICERCGGIATIAHHKRHITPENIINPKITLNWDNLKCVCIECHNIEHATNSATATGISFDLDGNVICTPPMQDKN